MRINYQMEVALVLGKLTYPSGEGTIWIGGQLRQTFSDIEPELAR